MSRLVRTDSTDTHFIELVAALDKDLAIRDGDEHGFYNQFNKLDSIKHVVLLYEDEKAVACGAIKQLDDSTMEVKRMYTIPEARGKNKASAVLQELENWAKEMSYQRCVLETGHKQPEAIQLYTKNGFTVIPNYGQYEGVENSICFEKLLSTGSPV